jgi:hypothetical protein
MFQHSVEQPAGHVSFEQVKRMLDQIQPGMNRAQVDAILPRSNGGIQGPLMTIYYEFPGLKIEVPFDGMYGFGHEQNRVIGRPKAFITVE